MAGLLDLFGSTDDAQRAGLLMLAAAGPRAQPASFGQRLLESVQQFDAGTQQKKDRAAQEEERKQRAAMQAMQMQQMQQSMADRAAQQQAAQEAAARRGGYLDSINPNAGPAQPFNPAAAMLAGLRPEEMKVLGPQEQENPFSKIDPKDYTPESVSQFARTRDFTQLRKLDKPETKPEILRVLAEAFGEGSPQYKAALTQYAQKATTHAPGVSVSYGAPVAGVNANGEPVFFQPSKDGGAPSILAGVAPPSREMPAAMAEKFAQNSVTLGKIDQAIELVRNNPGALGLKNYAPDMIVQRMDPEGVRVRAMIADIGGQKIHDRSGAAVTVGESERLKPYIPAATDSPPVAEEKLRLFRAEYADMQRALASGASIKQAASRGEAGGVPGAQPRRITSDADYAALPSGTVFIGPDGKTRRKP